MTQRNHFVKAMLTVAMALCCSTAVMAQQDSTSVQSDPTLLRKIVGESAPDWMKDVSDRIQLHGYAHGGYTYTRKGGFDANTFDIKRVLFWANAQITDRWSFLFMHDFSSVVQEFYTDYRITKNKALTVRLGQFKNGLSLENPLSPTVMEAIDVYSESVTFLTGCGSDPLYGVQYGRDLGLSFFGETNNGKLRYELDILNGQGINRKDANNSKDVIGRLEFRPVTGLNIVASGQIGRGHAVNTSLYNPTIALGQDYKRNRWTAGAEYKCKSFKVHGEYLEGWDGDAHSWGAYVTGSVPLGTPKVELVGSYDFFNFNTALGYDQHKAIAGLQYWFFKRCRAQVQYIYKSAYVAGNQFIKDGNHAVMCQMQIRFN